MAITLFVTNTYAQSVLESVQVDVSDNLVEHFQMFISENSTDVLLQDGQVRISRHQLLLETSEFLDILRGLNTRGGKTIADLGGKRKRFIYLLERMKEINDVLGPDEKVSELKKLSQFYRLRKLPGEPQGYESVLKPPSEIKLYKVFDLIQGVFKLRYVLLGKAMINPLSLTKLLAKYEASFRKALFISLYNHLSRLDNAQQVELLSTLINGEGEIKRMLYEDIRDHLQSINKNDIDMDGLVQKFEDIMKAEIANIIELAELDIDITKFRQEKNPWREAMRAELEGLPKDGVPDAKAPTRLLAILKFAKF